MYDCLINRPELTGYEAVLDWAEDGTVTSWLALRGAPGSFVLACSLALEVGALRSGARRLAETTYPSPSVRRAVAVMGSAANSLDRISEGLI